MKKYLVDSSLIIFSVLFALFINKLAGDYALNKEKSIAFNSIQMELSNNKSIAQKWYKNHSKILERITSMVSGKNQALKDKLYANNRLDLGLLTGGASLANDFLSSTAWDTAKTTGIISEFDFASIERLTSAYDLQGFMMEKTIHGLTDFVFSPEAHDKNNLDKNLIQLQLHFGELVGQELSLITYYSQALESLEETEK